MAPPMSITPVSTGLAAIETLISNQRSEAYKVDSRAWPSG